MGRELGQPAALADSIYQHNFFEDFNNNSLNLTTDDPWTDINNDTGTVGFDADGVGGVINLITDTTDNDQLYLHTTKELWLFAEGKDLTAICRLDFTEAATNTANVMFGLGNAVADDDIPNDGGIAAGKCLSAIYKQDTETVWRCSTALAAGTQPANQSTESAGRTNSETSAYQTLKIECQMVGDEMRVRYFCDPRGLAGFRPLKDSNGNIIQDTITLGTATEMSLFVGLKTGSAVAETVLIDYLGVEQVR